MEMRQKLGVKKSSQQDQKTLTNGGETKTW